ncbi:MAG: 2-amino-4-hydroxy-6-hydroxymethyldihydropteridine diphosphokinase [Actinomycetota bacterium]|nr:2-amino-4-hydroxy-6-hydroxymethyldihydropteridine diphosphokinase [Actinomycetota bacterium]
MKDAGGVEPPSLVRKTAYLGLGSNVGDRRAHLQAAVDELPRHGVTVLASSSIYETEPVGEVLDQRDFFNACLRVVTDLEPQALLAACKAVEAVLGRRPGVRHGPRSIDVDLLLSHEAFQADSLELKLPHPSITERRFVLVPLLELDPELEIPGKGRAAEALARLGAAQAVRRAAGPLRVSNPPAV